MKREIHKIFLWRFYFIFSHAYRNLLCFVNCNFRISTLCRLDNRFTLIIVHVRYYYIIHKSIFSYFSLLLIHLVFLPFDSCILFLSSSINIHTFICNRNTIYICIFINRCHFHETYGSPLHAYSSHYVTVCINSILAVHNKYFGTKQVVLLQYHHKHRK